MAAFRPVLCEQLAGSTGSRVVDDFSNSGSAKKRGREAEFGVDGGIFFEPDAADGSPQLGRILRRSEVYVSVDISQSDEVIEVRIGVFREAGDAVDVPPEEAAEEMVGIISSVEEKTSPSFT